MANTFNFTCIGHQRENFTDNFGEIPFILSNTVCLSYDIYFNVSLNFLKEKRLQIGLNTNLPSKLFVYICSSIESQSFEIIESYSFDINNSNILSGFLNKNITNIFKKESFNESLNEQQCLDLCKEIKIVFRIANDSESYTNNSLLHGDIINTINVIPNINQNGPYDVEYSFFDSLNPNTFTNSERINLYNQHENLLGYEGMTVYHPQNASNMPLVVIMHGFAHPHIGYKMYAAKLASYGYCVWLMNQETLGSGTAFEGQYHIVGKIQFFKNNVEKITNNLLTNKIDFNNIFVLGHSQGSVKVYSSLKDLTVSNTSSVGINHFFGFGLIGCGSIIFGSGNSVVTAFDSKCNFIQNKPLIIFGSDLDGSATGNSQYLASSNYSVTEDHNTVDIYQVTAMNMGHGVFFVDTSSADLPQTNENTYFPGLDKNILYIQNSNLNYVEYFSNKLLLFISNCLKGKIKEFLKISSNLDYSFKNKKTNECFLNYYYDMKTNSNDLSQINSTNNIVGGFDKTFSNVAADTTDGSFNESDLFSGIIWRSVPNANPKRDGIIFSYNSDCSINAYNGLINLTDNKYIAIYCAQRRNNVLNPEYIRKHFCLELIDSQSNSSIVSSKNYNDGIPPVIVFRNQFGSLATTFGSRSYCPIFFNLKDFIQKNPSLDVTNIEQINILFGPSYGDSQGRVAITRVVAVK